MLFMQHAQLRQHAHKNTDSTKYKARPIAKLDKTTSKKIPNTKARVSLQSEEPLKVDIKYYLSVQK
jgi:hypothetical protein